MLSQLRFPFFRMISCVKLQYHSPNYLRPPSLQGTLLVHRLTHFLLTPWLYHAGPNRALLIVQGRTLRVSDDITPSPLGTFQVISSDLFYK